MNIKVIANGSTKIDSLLKKWGLSVLIDADVLFDTFCSPKILKSGFKKYKIDPYSIKHVVISHEHWDHTGGLWWLLKNNNNIKVYACSRFSEGFKKKVRQSGAALIEVTGSMPVKDGILSTGEIKGHYNSSPLYEQSLIVSQKDRLAVITGCSHPGILDILTQVRLEFKSEIDLLLGGLHLTDKPEEELFKITAVFNSIYKIKNLAPLHCTGAKALKHFKQYLPHGLVQVRSGDYFSFNGAAASWELHTRKFFNWL